MEIRVEKTKSPKAKPDFKNLGFGKYFTDHMFLVDYVEGEGWKDARIVPYGPLEIDPSCMVLHYGQEIFEGMKAYPCDGKILLFRPEMNARRMNSSAERLCMAQIPEELFIEGVSELVKVDRDWIPTEEGTSLYIRPFMISTQNGLGVHASMSYQFIVILSPVGAYYPEGLNPVKIYVEDEYVRSVKGGTGFTKCGGNYAASIIAQSKAADKGYTQVLWLDGIERKYVEEVGTMNVMFKIDGEVVTPKLEGSVLPGVTRNSCLELLREMGLSVSERKLSIDELVAAYKAGKLEEAFGTGTAAVISPIGELYYEGERMVIGGGKIGPVSQKLYDTLTGIQWGKIKDTLGWVREVK